MKKILMLMFVSLSLPVFAQLGGALIGGGVGGGLVGGLTNVVGRKIQDKRQQNINERTGCYNSRGEKVSNLGEPIQLAPLDLEAARRDYYTRKNAN